MVCSRRFFFTTCLLFTCSIFSQDYPVHDSVIPYDSQKVYGNDVVSDSVGRGKVSGGATSVSSEVPDVKKIESIINPLNGFTVLHSSCQTGTAASLKSVLHLIGQGFNLELVDKLGRTPLHVAVLGRSLDHIKALLKAGAQVDCADQKGMRPLHLAVIDKKNSKQCMVDVIRLLINFGADTCAKNKKGWIPVKLVKAKGISPVRKALSTSPDLSILMFQGDVTKAGSFFSHEEYPLCVRDVQGRTLLHNAALGGHLFCIDFLVKKDTQLNVNAQDKALQTPLHLATRQGHFDFVKALIELKADTKVQDEEGQTILHVAVMGLHEDLINLLLDYVDLNTKNKRGYTSLFCLASVEKLDIKKGLEIAQNHIVEKASLHLDGNSVLDCAFTAGNRDFAYQLLKQYSKDHKLDKQIDVCTEQYHLLHRAAQGCYGADGLAVVKKLLEYGFRVDVKDSLGRIPLFYAIDRVYKDDKGVVHTEMVEELLKGREGLPLLTEPAVSERKDSLMIIVSPWAYALLNNEIIVLKIFIMHDCVFYTFEDATLSSEDKLAAYTKYLESGFDEHAKQLKQVSEDIPDIKVETFFDDHSFKDKVTEMLVTKLTSNTE